jgi:hypothetical protein
MDAAAGRDGEARRPEGSRDGKPAVGGGRKSHAQAAEARGGRVQDLRRRLRFPTRWLLWAPPGEAGSTLCGGRWGGARACPATWLSRPNAEVLSVPPALCKLRDASRHSRSPQKRAAHLCIGAASAQWTHATSSVATTAMAARERYYARPKSRRAPLQAPRDTVSKAQPSHLLSSLGPRCSPATAASAFHYHSPISAQAFAHQRTHAAQAHESESMSASGFDGQLTRADVGLAVRRVQASPRSAAAEDEHLPG